MDTDMDGGKYDSILGHQLCKKVLAKYVTHNPHDYILDGVCPIMDGFDLLATTPLCKCMIWVLSKLTNLFLQLGYLFIQKLHTRSEFLTFQRPNQSVHKLLPRILVLVGESFPLLPLYWYVCMLKQTWTGCGEFWEGICVYNIRGLRKRLRIIISCVEWCSWWAI
jgi:hypothetical protein